MTARKPPSSPTLVPWPPERSSRFSAWYTSAPARSASEKFSMPAGATMNSWMSVESWACLPPLRMLSMGTGSVTPAPRCRYRGTPLDAAAAWATASDTPSTALAPMEDLSGVPSASRSRWSTVAWSWAERPDTARASRRFTFSTAVRTPTPPKREASPSRSSTASYWPVLAPEGTAARPRAPSDRRTSTSTVGLPRESRISRARTSTIDAVMLSPARRLPRPTPSQPRRWVSPPG